MKAARKTILFLLLFCCIPCVLKAGNRNFHSFAVEHSESRLALERTLVRIGAFARMIFRSAGNSELRIVGSPDEHLSCEARGSMLIIRLPDGTEWADDRDALALLARKILLSAAGRPLREAETYPACWLIDALILRCSRENLPGTFYPGASAMLSSGIVPELRRITSSSLRYADAPACYEIQQEWADLLLEFCIRSSAVKNGSAEKYLLGFPQEKKDREEYAFFLECFFPGEEHPDQVFRAGVEKMLLNRLLPMKSVRSEHVYRKLLAEASGKKGLSCTEIFEPANEKILRIAPDAFRKLGNGFLRLLRCLPPGTEQPFTDLLHALNRSFREEKPDLALLAEKEKRFLDSLAFYASIEKHLAEAEKRTVPSAERLALTLSASEREDARNMLNRPLERKGHLR